jgi:hypothetical protein
MKPVCSLLRWKGRRENQSMEEREATFRRNAVPYTCLLTGQPWGPTDLLAAPEACTCERPCWRAK